MDLKTAVAILNQQVKQLILVADNINSQVYIASQLVEEENSIPNPVDQIKSLMASMNIQMTSLNSQSVIVQQAIDNISGLIPLS